MLFSDFDIYPLGPAGFAHPQESLSIHSWSSVHVFARHRDPLEGIGLNLLHPNFLRDGGQKEKLALLHCC